MPNIIKNILAEYVKGLSDLIGSNLEKVILYGSYARGNYSKNDEVSDIDIMILVNTDNVDTINAIQEKVLDYSYDFDLKYDVLLSPFVQSIKIYNNRVLYMPFYQNVAKEGVLLNG